MTASPRRILVLIDLVQDLDVLLPVLIRLKAAPGLESVAVISRWLARRAPRIQSLLDDHGLDFTYTDRSRLLAGSAPALDGVSAVLMGAESSAGPHRWAHALAARAKAYGIPTFSVQHGLDNLRALSWPPESHLQISSDILFCWPPEGELPANLDPQTRVKLVCVGRAILPTPARAPVFDVGVFENLHAKTYTDGQRRMVVDRILELARVRPALRICVRTHPAGGWLDRFSGRFRACRNVSYVSSAEARRSPEPGAEAVAQAARVIATPSTVVLDAAMACRPTALALDGGPIFAPLPVLESMADWLAFADAPAIAGETQSGFLALHLLGGDAASRIVEHLVAAIGKNYA